jgi:phage terminase large subunit
VGFVRDVLNCRLWPMQEEILRSVVGSDRIAIRSGQKCGKSRLVVFAALWFVCCFEGAKVIMTAPTARQVREILWNELRNVCNGAARPLGASPAKTPAGGMRFKDGRQIIGFSVTDTKSENMAGTSGATLMYVIDEASGFSNTIFDAIEGNLGGSKFGRLLAISNPTQPSGFFFDAFHRSAATWKKFALSSEEASKYADEFPGLMRPETIQRKEKDAGRDSPWFRIRILGQFPSSAVNSVVSLAQLDAAKERFLAEAFRRLCAQKMADPTTDGTGRVVGLSNEEVARLFGPSDGALEVGVDVARFGDDSTVICPRRGRYLLPYETRSGADSIEVAGAILAVVRMHRQGGEPRARVKIDGTGGWGSGVVDTLRKVEPYRSEIEVIEINVSTKADDEEHFPNMRSQLWFGFPEWLKDGGAIFPMAGEEDGKLESELLTPTYKFDPRGRKVVEPKDDTKKRLNRSPDRADAGCLAVYSAQSMPLVMPLSPAAAKSNAGRWGSDRGF